MLLIQLACLVSTFSTEASETGDRLANGLTILLTTVAYQIYIGTLLPKLSYMTFTDKYIAFSNFFIAAVIFQLAYLGFGQKLKSFEKFSEQDDFNMFLVWVSLYAIFNLCVWMYAFIIIIPRQNSRLTNFADKSSESHDDMTKNVSVIPGYSIVSKTGTSTFFSEFHL